MLCKYSSTVISSANITKSANRHNHVPFIQFVGGIHCLHACLMYKTVVYFIHVNCRMCKPNGYCKYDNCMVPDGHLRPLSSISSYFKPRSMRFSLAQLFHLWIHFWLYYSLKEWIWHSLFLFNTDLSMCHAHTNIWNSLSVWWVYQMLNISLVLIQLWPIVLDISAPSNFEYKICSNLLPRLWTVRLSSIHRSCLSIRNIVQHLISQTLTRILFHWGWSGYYAKFK